MVLVVERKIEHRIGVGDGTERLACNKEQIVYSDEVVAYHAV